MNLAFAINKNFVQHFCVTLKSIEENNNLADWDVHIMYLDLTNSDIEVIERNFENIKFTWHDLNDYDFSGFFVNAHITYESYFRIIAPQVINKEKLLYLDSDLIVRKSLENLYKIDIRDYFIGAVYDYKVQTRKEALNIPNNYMYFNAGVLLMNLSYMREKNLTETLVNYIKKMGDKLTYHDQDALNALLYDKTLRLDDCWNVQTASFESEFINADILEDPAIVHFTGASKPWHISSTNKFKNEYFVYLNLTSFKDYNIISKQVTDLIANKQKIYIWGAGITGKAVSEYLKIKVEGFIDSNIDRIGTLYLDLPIYAIEQIEMTDEIGIIVCTGHFNEISKVLNAKGYRKNIDYVHQM